MKTKNEIAEILKHEFPFLLETRFYGEGLDDVTEMIYESALHVREDKENCDKEIQQAQKAMIAYNSKTKTTCFIHSTRDFDSILKYKDEFPEIMNFTYSFPSLYTGKQDKPINEALQYLSEKANTKIIITGRKIKYNGIYDCSYVYSGHNDSSFVPAYFHYDEIWELITIE